MTATRARYIARREEEERRRRERVREAVMGFIAAMLVLALFALAGTTDYHDDQAQLAYWRERGVTIQRW